MNTPDTMAVTWCSCSRQIYLDGTRLNVFYCPSFGLTDPIRGRRSLERSDVNYLPMTDVNREDNLVKRRASLLKASFYASKSMDATGSSTKHEFSLNRTS